MESVRKNIISVNLKKIKANKKVARLIDENYRNEKTAEKYDDGKRIISTEKTKENIFLIKRPTDYDLERKQLLDDINLKRKQRTFPSLKLKNFKSGWSKEKLKTENNRFISKTRKLRADTVDTLGIVVQPQAEFIENLSRDDQINFFSDALEVIQSNYDDFGEVKTAVIHFDENTPHMQILSNTLNTETLTSDASRIYGNKTKLSLKQDFLANGLRAKGWDVTRGIKRVDNPNYKNFKSEAEAQGFRLSRFNDGKLAKSFSEIKKEKNKNLKERVRLEKKESDLDIRENKFLSWVTQFKKEQEEKYKKRMQEIDKRKRDLDNRESKIKRSEELLDNRELELGKREENVLKREKELDEREKQLEDIEKDLKRKYAEEIRRNQELKQKQKDLYDKNAMVLAYQEALEERKKELVKNQKAVSSDFEEIKDYVFNGDLEADELSEKLKSTDLSDLSKAFDELKKKGQENQSGLDR